MGVITVSGIKLYAYHGCMKEEAKIGSDYEVDVVLESDLSKAANMSYLKKLECFAMNFYNLHRTHRLQLRFHQNRILKKRKELIG